MNLGIVTSCVEKGCKINTEIGDLLFCKFHRSKWQYVCSLGTVSVESIQELNKLRDSRLSLLRGI